MAKPTSKAPIILGAGEFEAIDAEEAKTVLASVIKNIKTGGPIEPDAIRLIDAEGREIWCTLLSTQAAEQAKRKGGAPIGVERGRPREDCPRTLGGQGERAILFLWIMFPTTRDLSEVPDDVCAEEVKRARLGSGRR